MKRLAFYGGLWATLTGLTWYEAYLIHRVLQHEYVAALHEREIASICRSITLTGGALMGVNQLAGRPLPEGAVRVIMTASLAASAIPAIRFVRQHYRIGLR